MSSFSAQPNYSSISTDTLSDVITITSSVSDYSTITLSDTISFPTSPTYTISTATGSGGIYNYGSGATVGGITNIGTISSIDTSTFTFNPSEEWVNCFPDFNRIEKMCKEYPGLKIAYEKFVTTYKLVADHYDTPEDKRPKP
jgi:hypothetical protein